MIDWTDIKPDIYINFLSEGGPGTMNCYNGEGLRTWLSNPDNTLYRWKARQDKVLNDIGHGGGPDLTEGYVKLYTGEYVQEDDNVNDLRNGMTNVYYNANTLETQVRLGNRHGTFGIGQSHGQAPGFRTYKLVRTDLLKTSTYIKDMNVPTLPDATIANGGWVYDDVFEPKRLSGMYSPKMYRVVENIMNNIQGKHVIYSILKTRSGVRLMQALLEMCGIRTLVYSGDIPSDERRSQIIDAFNSDENLRGEKYKVMLITEAGGVGITLKAVKYIHILEADKNELKVQQAIGRSIRYGSHDGLPSDERFVKVFRYFSIPHPEIVATIEKKIKPEDREKFLLDGIDQVLYNRGQLHAAQINVFLGILQTASSN